MAPSTLLQSIGADAHVVETERTCDSLTPSEQLYRLLLYASPAASVGQYWVIDGNIRGLRFPPLAAQTVRDRRRACGGWRGGNGSRNHLWKFGLQQLANDPGMRMTVCHFPPGTNKWNKIEHRMLSHISMNWRG